MIFYSESQVKFLIILLVGLYLMFIPAILHAETNAGIVINEIVYDPVGADTGREWIEVYNAGAGEIDLATYKLLENNVNHKLAPVTEGGSLILSADGYAILVDNPDKFRLDFPNYNGLLIDTTFSLNNTGELLSIVDSAGTVIDTFTYSSDLGANDNGNSLQKNNTGFWIGAGPTVGTLNKQEAEIPVSDTDDSGNNSNSSSTGSSSTSSANSAHSGQNSLSNYVEKVLLEIGLGRNRTTTINTPIEFQAVYNTEQKPKFMWSFGDGDTENGYKINHAYKNAGTYNVVLNAFLNNYQATARAKVTAVESNVEIMSISQGKDVDIMLKNLANKEVNLGGFIIKVGPKEFKIPEDTIIDSKSNVILSYNYTHFQINDNFRPAEILYPEGQLLYKETLTGDFINSFIALIPTL